MRPFGHGKSSGTLGELFFSHSPMSMRALCCLVLSCDAPRFVADVSIIFFWYQVTINPPSCLVCYNALANMRFVHSRHMTPAIPTQAPVELSTESADGHTCHKPVVPLSCAQARLRTQSLQGMLRQDPLGHQFVSQLPTSNC